ncbi:alpha/beta-type small acid-soluble spore protein [Falsibacillus pallidus]|uniref:Small acid-soluble spore protein alpha/beta type n=1 Tax=Falsibacillus pallidus TaxID=493781 RepID=A0A370GEM1_9BACI|nr:alpha/beta-type small acid-soluble spore protein [Falsibacillus pallidus]RDI41549.1 small acid-soluble spore protein alpha/beta type [Falsibacillus pallidus]
MARRKILVPESRAALDQLKARVTGAADPADARFEAAREQGIPLQKGYNGKLTSEEAGKVGGRIGGSMVQELIRMAKNNLKE